MRRCGETGRRAGLKILWSKIRVGSSPTTGTNEQRSAGVFPMHAVLAGACIGKRHVPRRRRKVLLRVPVGGNAARHSHRTHTLMLQADLRIRRACRSVHRKKTRTAPQAQGAFARTLMIQADLRICRACRSVHRKNEHTAPQAQGAFASACRGQCRKAFPPDTHAPSGFTHSPCLQERA